MWNLFRAEWQKVVGHRWLSGFLIWIFPVGIAGYVCVIILAAAFSEHAVREFSLDTVRWTQVEIVWQLLSRFPAHLFTRLPLIAFAAAMFAGEYEWHTWKNLLPHSQRASLVACKFVILVVAVLISFTLTSIIWGVGFGIAAKLAGVPYGPPPTSEVLAEFARSYTLDMSLALVSTALAAGYAALAGVLARSIPGGLLIGLVGSWSEPFFPLAFDLIANLLGRPGINNLTRFLPFYNLENVSSWVREGTAYVPLPTFGPPAESSLAFSITVLALWIGGLIALTAYLFQRQDITA